MFKLTNMKKVNKLDLMIDKYETKLLKAETCEDKEDALRMLQALKKMKVEDKKTGLSVTGDTLVTCATSLGSVLLMLNFEQLGVIRSKALNFIIKGRV